MSGAGAIQRLRHNRVELALHTLAAGGPGHPLLLLHALGERAPAELPETLSLWPGGVHALDFTGHGASDVPDGGGYTCELLMGDADHALAALGGATVLGRGLGAYVALLLAGARPGVVRGAILCDGPGLAGGGTRPGTPLIPWREASAPAPPDPFALVELATDVRPPDYATSFARQAAQLSPLDTPLAVCAVERPDWLRAVADEPGVRRLALEDALALYAGPRAV